ncbi:MAG: pentapeptide repeat-containing protein [Spirochaetaceae bacterium]|jgi:uncharacterized protein YjbI with pentapeptide repeats|nr:pentapeptide repeat-containing protein [Spirochaetaceae bacterium]
MFNAPICAHPDCGNPVIGIFGDGGAAPFGEFCFLHTHDQGAALKFAVDYVDAHEKIVGLNAMYMPFSEVNLEGKLLYGCVFRRCDFRNVSAEHLRARMCIFDFASFKKCAFKKVNVQFASFAGTDFADTQAVSSVLVNNNFSGVTLVNSAFDDTDFYNSRFVKARISDSNFTNCNLQRTIFYGWEENNVSFKLSSTRGAAFSLPEAGA